MEAPPRLDGLLAQPPTPTIPSAASVVGKPPLLGLLLRRIVTPSHASATICECLEGCAEFHADMRFRAKTGGGRLDSVYREPASAQFLVLA